MPRMRNVCPGTKRERAASDKPVAFAAETTKSETIGQLERLALGCSVKEEKLSRSALSAIARKATSLYLLKGRTMKLVIVLLAFGIGLGTPALAQSPTAPPAAPSANDIQFTNHDIVTLLKATKDAETSPNITIDIVGKVDTDMPAYDPIVHFVGIDAKSGAATIWIMKSPAKTPAAAQALRAAMELACMATGFAGPAWKTMYDQVATWDTALPTDSPNPYKYRLALTQRIESILNTYAPH